MASSFELPCVNHPVRSISLPSREHPNTLKIESVLTHLKYWQPTSDSKEIPFGAETIQVGLVGLSELYICLEDFIGSPHTQQALLQYQNGKIVDEALDGSVTLLDTCSSARDMLLLMKQHVQTLQSSLRRQSNIESTIDAYFSFRKRAKRDIVKCLRDLTKMEDEVGSSLSFPDLDHHVSTLINVLREATTITMAIFRALLLFLSTPAMNKKAGKWAMVSKLLNMRSLSLSKKQNIVNEMEIVDFSLYAIQGQRRAGDAKIEVQGSQKMLETVDVHIHCFEAGLDCVFKRLVQYRVSLLNMLTH